MQEALDIDQYSIAICIFPCDKLHLLQSVMSHVNYRGYLTFFMKRGGKVSGHLHSTEYNRSPIPGGLEVPIEVTFTNDKINHDLG